MSYFSKGCHIFSFGLLFVDLYQTKTNNMENKIGICQMEASKKYPSELKSLQSKQVLTLKTIKK